MSSSAAATTSNDADRTPENACCVCFRDVEIFSIGECDHVICFECSTRMRVLCGQSECPFCRQAVAKVIYSEEKQPYRLLDANIRSGLYDKRYRICFANLQVQNAFYKLLENPCPKCPAPERTFVSFELLKKHVSREHQHYYCDLCTDNLKIFPFERQCYTRSDLALHNRKGDVNDKSHRGHPLCEYCDVRYLDRDELFRHLRREHYFCHFCDADGSNQFYEDYPSLRDHFQREHFVCDEGSCVDEQFTGVFRTEIDLKVHQAKQHSSSMGKMAAKQARTLELEFSLVPRNRAGNGPGGGGGGGAEGRDGRDRGNRNNGRGGGGGGGGGASSSAGENPYLNLVPGPSQINLHPQQMPKRVIDSNNEQEFPSLGGGGASSNGASSARQDVTIRAKAFKATGGSGKLTRTNENFPALGGNSAAAGAASSAGPSVGGNYKKVSASAILKAKPAATNGSAETAQTAKPGTVIHISNRQKNNFADFPALSRGARIANLDSGPAVTEMMSQLHVNNSAISAKHRGLVDEYTIASAVAQKHTSKIGMVQAAAAPVASPTKSAPTKLKLKSDESFPSLSGNSGGAPGPSAWNSAGTPKWVNKPKVESRKSKVATNPLSASETTKKEKNNNKQKQTTDSKGKGDAGQKQQQQQSNSNGGLMANGLILGQKGGSNSSSSSAPPPPGFNSKPSNAPGPPPGFNVTLNSVSRNGGGNSGGGSLMFTNSAGEKYKIVPTRRYIPPPMTQKRNQELVNVFKQTLTTPEAMQEFKTISQMFRENAYNAVPYYDHCKVALGERFTEIFPELLALLPEIGKQQELFLVYRQNEGGKKGKTSKLEVCPTCKQVLVPEDLKPHVEEHAVEQNFPKLSK